MAAQQEIKTNVQKLNLQLLHVQEVSEEMVKVGAMGAFIAFLVTPPLSESYIRLCTRSDLKEFFRVSIDAGKAIDIVGGTDEDDDPVLYILVDHLSCRAVLRLKLDTDQGDCKYTLEPWVNDLSKSAVKISIFEGLNKSLLILVNECIPTDSVLVVVNVAGYQILTLLLSPVILQFDTICSILQKKDGNFLIETSSHINEYACEIIELGPDHAVRKRLLTDLYGNVSMRCASAEGSIIIFGRDLSECQILSPDLDVILSVPPQEGARELYHVHVGAAFSHAHAEVLHLCEVVEKEERKRFFRIFSIYDH